ncbi:hypothetical protein NADFUDRAFT_82206 [Nadsonia fulvescens var. elongata DSM 6958]|uniref:CRT10-domain-containing protein n=1 Tax=Nadsonia fulvescens var. elongata DSM 6958 TaxID=857566 RepID=A0A1E3PLP8_9ASCO|nr:hypothetical protein NADFUDRAFT_82206 [Nadsonia fulvescens var. elongata DSM 6958]
MSLSFNKSDETHHMFKLSLERYDTLIAAEDSPESQHWDSAASEADDESPEDEEYFISIDEEEKEEPEVPSEEGKKNIIPSGSDLNLYTPVIPATRKYNNQRKDRNDYLASHNLDSSDDEGEIDYRGNSMVSSRQSPYLTPTGVLSVSSLIPPNDQLKAIPRSQLSKQYPNSLNLRYLTKGTLYLSSMNHHRNNLTTSSNDYNMVFVAVHSEIRIFDINSTTGSLNPLPKLRFETKPSILEPSMTRGANWPSDPHGINFLKLGRLGDQEVLASASDNGRVLLWLVRELMIRINQVESQSINTGALPFHLTELIQVPPKLIIKQTQSAWGIDFHNQLQLLAISDNTHHVYVYLLDNYMNKIKNNDYSEYRIEDSSVIFEPKDRNPIISPQMTHNIPDVSFISDSEYERVKQAFFISCISIMGEVSLWEYYYTTDPDDETIRIEVNSVYGNNNHRIHSDRHNHYPRDHNNEPIDSVPSFFMDPSMLVASGSSNLSDAFDPTRLDPQGLADGDESFTSEDIPSFASGIEIPPQTERAVANSNTDDTDDNDSYIDEEQDSSNNSAFDGNSDDDTRNNRNYHHNEYLADMDGIWRYCFNIGQRGWSINYVNASDFKEVNSLYEVTGNKWYDEDSHFGQMERDTARLLELDKAHPNSSNSSSKPYTIPKVTTLKSSEVITNPNANTSALKQKLEIQRISEDCMNRFSYFEILSLPIQPRASVLASFSNEQHYLLPICRKRKEKKQRFIHRLKAQIIPKQRLLSSEIPLTAAERHNLEKKVKRMELAGVLNDKFVVLTTKKSLYLCRANDLYCNGACSNVFSWEYQFGTETVYFDILSITEVIPELSAVVVASHIGSVALYRMVKYRGIYSLRQEYRFPDPEHFLFANEHDDLATINSPGRRRNATLGLNTNESVIAGISVKKVQMGSLDEKLDKRFGDIEVGTKKYKLFVFYIGGKFLTYEITRKEGKDELIVENIVF